MGIERDRCSAHARENAQKAERRRGSAHKRGYGRAWEQARKAFLMNVQIAKRIRARRLELRKTQSECSFAIGKSHAYWAHIEGQKVRVNPDMELIAKVLECSVRDLTHGFGAGVCSRCACTFNRPCVLSRGPGRWHTCAWADEEETLCTFCVHVETQEPAAGWSNEISELIDEALLPT